MTSLTNVLQLSILSYCFKGVFMGFSADQCIMSFQFIPFYLTHIATNKSSISTFVQYLIFILLRFVAL